MSDAARSFTRVAQVGDIVAIACTPDGSLVGVNDSDGRVCFYAVDDQHGEPLPLRFCLADATGVLLHPDGRVISFVGGCEPIVRIHDPRTGAQLRSFVLAPVEWEDGFDDYDGYALDDPSAIEQGFYFGVALLERSSQSQALAIESMPNRFTRMALHPNRRWLAVLDRAVRVVDLDSGAVLGSLDERISLVSLFEDGQGPHTVGFDDRGLLTIASGTPSPELARFDVESDLHEAITDIDVDDPTAFFPPAQIPAGSYKALIRRAGIELWSPSGLIRGVPLGERTRVIPSFDPASFCREPRALLVTAERLELLDLVTGERTRLQPPSTSRLSHTEFDPTRQRLLLWRERAALLTAAIGEDRWNICELPQARRMRDWAFASQRGRAFVVDDAGELWLADVDLEPQPPASSSDLPLHDLERDLLAQPHEPARFLVLADALHDRGDPWGELIVLQHQRAFDQANSLIEHNRPALLGPLATLAPDNFDLRWERGFVRIAKFTITADQLHEVLAFLASTRARLLESLELRVKGNDALTLYAQIDAYLAAARHLPLLRSLKLGAPGQYTPSAINQQQDPR